MRCPEAQGGEILVKKTSSVMSPFSPLNMGTLRNVNSNGQTARLGQRTLGRGQIYHLPGKIELSHQHNYSIDFYFGCFYVLMEKIIEKL